MEEWQEVGLLWLHGVVVRSQIEELSLFFTDDREALHELAVISAAKLEIEDIVIDVEKPLRT